MNTYSLVPLSERDFDIMCEVIERLESEQKIFDVELFEEYNNIIFDCDEIIQDYIVAFLQISFPDIGWQLTANKGERILKVLTYRDSDLYVEDINKTFDEIDEENKAACESNCSGCKCDCSGCDEHKCAFDFDVEQVTESFEEMSSEAFFKYFAELCVLLADELDKYCDAALQDICDEIISETNEPLKDDSDECCEPVEDLPDHEEIYDLFWGSLVESVLAAAGSSGCYTEKEHEYIEILTDRLDFEKAKNVALEPNIDDCIRTFDFWRDAEVYSKCDVRKICLMLCAMVCCCDGKANAEEKTFLKHLAEA